MGKRIDLTDSCAIITGATGGIGSQFALELARRGAGLILLDLNEEKLIKTADSISRETGVAVHILPLDLTDPDAVNKLDNFCKELRINPDILINNAGIFSFSGLTEMDAAKIEIFINLHVRAVTMLSRWFAIRRAEAGSGWLLNMSSMSCWMPMPGLAMYSATKAYLRVFSRSLHYEMRDAGVSVTVACPGGIATDLFGLPANLKKLAVRLRALDTPDSFAKKAIDRMLKKKKQYINGWLNRFSIFFVGITPTPVRMMVKHKLLDKGIVR